MARRKLLIVDDEPAVLKVCQLALAKLGLDIKTAPDEKGALKLLKDNEFDCVLVDFKLKEHDGLSIIKKAHQLYPNIHAILMTGTLKSDKLEDKIKQVKLNAVIYKPFSVDQLRNVVREVLKL